MQVLRSIHEVFRLQNTDLDLSGNEIFNAQVSSKYKHSFVLLVFIARLLHKIVRCSMFLSPLKNWSYPQLFSFPSSVCHKLRSRDPFYGGRERTRPVSRRGYHLFMLSPPLQISLSETGLGTRKGNI